MYGIFAGCRGDPRGWQALDKLGQEKKTKKNRKRERQNEQECHAQDFVIREANHAIISMPQKSTKNPKLNNFIARVNSLA